MNLTGKMGERMEMEDSFLEEMNFMSKSPQPSKDTNSSHQQIERGFSIHSSSGSSFGFPKASTPEPHKNYKYYSPILNPVNEKLESTLQNLQRQRNSTADKSKTLTDPKTLDIMQQSLNHRSRIAKAKSPHQKNHSRFYINDSASPEVSRKENVKPTQKECTSKNLNLPGLNEQSALLNAIEGIVSSHTKSESAKIMQSMMEIHLHSLSNIIKQNILQTDDIVKELIPERDTSQLRSVVRENEKLKQDIRILQLRNEELRRVVDEAVLLREENVALKLRLKELSK